LTLPAAGMGASSVLVIHEGRRAPRKAYDVSLVLDMLFRLGRPVPGAFLLPAASARWWGFLGGGMKAVAQTNGRFLVMAMEKGGLVLMSLDGGCCWLRCQATSRTAPPPRHTHTLNNRPQCSGNGNHHQILSPWKTRVLGVAGLAGSVAMAGVANGLCKYGSRTQAPQILGRGSCFIRAPRQVTGHTLAPGSNARPPR